MSQQFDIRRLEVGETANPETDWYLSNIDRNELLPVDHTAAIDRGHRPHYRITLKEPEQPEVARQLQIEAGKFYSTRSGAKVGPVKYEGNKKYMWSARDGGAIRMYDQCGRWHPDAKEHACDLIAPWDEPEQPEAESVVDPGEGWRLLEPNEPIQQGDETAIKDREPLAWFETGRWIDRLPQLSDMHYRRRIPAPPEPQAEQVPRSVPSIDYQRRAETMVDQFRREHPTQWSEAVQAANRELNEKLAELRKANAELSERCNGLEGSLATAKIICDSIKEIKTERDKLAERVRELESQLAASQAKPEQVQELTANAVEWVVNDNAELGVKIGNQFFWLYKGNSLVYRNGCHDDGSPMLWRHVGKREFGECCHPRNMDVLPEKYTAGDGWQILQLAEPPQEEWRELKPGEQYSGPGQVRDYDEMGWSDAVIVATDNINSLPFVAKKIDSRYYGACKLARVRVKRGAE